MTPGHRMAGWGLVLFLLSTLAAPANDEAPRVQRALRELESVRTLAAETTNVTEQAMWENRVVLAEKRGGERAQAGGAGIA